jgi:DNA-directed RNA polymerase specialized sigma24 family protein
VTTFPETQRSLLEALRSEDAADRERATDLVARVYRAPIITVAMHRWGHQHADAEDLAHDFLAQAFEKEWFMRYDASRGRFRTFLRTCLVAFAKTRAESAARQKRGGVAQHVSMDDIEVAAAPDPALDDLFDREWVRSVLALSVDALRAECEAAGRATTFAVFLAHDVDAADLDAPPSYASLARRFSIPVTQVTNFLNWARRRFRAHVLATLRSLTTSDAEFREEARALLGVEFS